MVVDSTSAAIPKEKLMPETEITKLTRTTASGFLARNANPKYKYIEDPSDLVSVRYKNQYSQFNVEYHELKLSVWPILGRFSGNRVTFHYDWDTVKVDVDDQQAYVMFLKAGTSPEHFQRFCLNFLYSKDAEEQASKHQLETPKPTPERKPATLSVQCLRSVAVNMERIPSCELQYLPQSYQGLFPQDCFVQATFNLWPTNIKGRSTILTIRKDIIVSELKILLQHKLNLESGSNIRVFKNVLRLLDDDVLQGECDVNDCVITSPKVQRKILPLAAATPRVSPTTKDVLVISVVGKEMKEIFINLSLPLKYLDIQLRQAFRLKPSSFLAMYIPEEKKNIFHTGRFIYTSYEEEFAKFLTSNGKRNFPKPDKGLSTLGIKQLYDDCSSFKKSLRSLGFHPGTLVEVFEITGPSIPVMYFGTVTKSQVIDVNPDWSLLTFLYYMEVSTPQASKIQTIDYVRDCSCGKVQDVLEMMQSLWSRPDDGCRLEYVRIRS